MSTALESSGLPVDGTLGACAGSALARSVLDGEMSTAGLAAVPLRLEVVRPLAPAAARIVDSGDCRWA